MVHLFPISVQRRCRSDQSKGWVVENLPSGGYKDFRSIPTNATNCMAGVIPQESVPKLSSSMVCVTQMAETAISQVYSIIHHLRLRVHRFNLHYFFRHFHLKDIHPSCLSHFCNCWPSCETLAAQKIRPRGHPPETCSERRSAKSAYLAESWPGAVAWMRKKPSAHLGCFANFQLYGHLSDKWVKDILTQYKHWQGTCCPSPAGSWRGACANLASP